MAAMNLTRGKAAGCALVLGLSPLLWADELESLFDSANTAKTENVGATKADESMWIRFIRTQLANPLPDQSLFIQSVEQGEWNKAVLQYSAAFEGTALQKSPNGRALYALVHFKAGLPVTGLELLFKTVENISEVHPELRTMWSAAAPGDHPAWKTAQLRWSPSYSEVFSSQAEQRTQILNLSAVQGVEALRALDDKLPKDGPASAQVGWRLSLAYASANQIEDAAKTLAEVMKSKFPPASRDLMEMTAARLLYQRALFAGAIKYYEKVGKDSEYWLDAQEEIAWSYIRKGEPQNAIAVSTSLVSPVLASQAGAEGFFVHSLAQLKICDYPGVMQTLAQFGKRFKARTEVLTKLSTAAEGPAVMGLIEQLKSKRLTRTELGRNGAELPRMAARDERLYSLAQTQKVLEAEANAADLLYSQSLAISGLQGYFEKLKQDLRTRARNARSGSQQRVKELAVQESTEIKEILRKLHIVEAEVIQQVSLAERIAQNTRAEAREKIGTTGSKDRDVLKFKAEKEIWFDEIGNFRMNVKKACHAANTRKSS
jgi:hypothetical protein